MNPLITIHTHLIGTEETNAVDARELHGTLQIGRDFSSWIKRQIISLGLEENVDYIVFTKKGENPSGGRPHTDYILTIDAAKHIALASRTEKGRQVRAYFIEAERRLRLGGDMPQTQIQHILEQLTKSIEILSRTQLHLFERIEAIEKKQAHPLPKAPANYPPHIANRMRSKKWTAKELATVLELYGQGYTAAEVGAEIGKSAVAVRIKLARYVRAH